MCVSGVLVFFFLTRQIPTVQEEVPNLNFHWVPILVRVKTQVPILYNLAALVCFLTFVCFLLDGGGRLISDSSCLLQRLRHMCGYSLSLFM